MTPSLPHRQAFLTNHYFPLPPVQPMVPAHRNARAALVLPLAGHTLSRCGSEWIAFWPAAHVHDVGGYAYEELDYSGASVAFVCSSELRNLRASGPGFGSAGNTRRGSCIWSTRACSSFTFNSSEDHLKKII